MNPKLFQSSEFYHRRYHNFATVLVIPMTLLVFFLLAFSLIGKKEITVTTLGSIRPTKVIAVVQSSSNNTVLTNNLSENKAVKKGDLLIQYSDKLEDSQLNAIQTQIERYERQQEALNQLKESLKQGQNLFTGDDEFGYSATVERFLNQSQTITAQVSQSNQSVAKQEAGVNQANTAIAIRLPTYKPKSVNIKKLKRLFKLTKQTYLAIIHMQLLLIAILARFKQVIHKVTTILLAKKALKINF
ncbi:hypothetical protein [Streptococcus orisratti]|uniref:hypothetical protein n=1 Tax=Streptococcus orisratti TaxID=114652 RepID=UPI003D027BBA